MHGAYPSGHDFRRSARPRARRLARAVIAAARCAMEALEDRVLFATFTVTNTLDNGAGSLRTAITSADSAAGADTIAFAIPGTGTHTISPATALPAITGPTTIDGGAKNGDGSVQVEINGDNVPAPFNTDGSLLSGVGLQITGGGTTIRNLAINRFPLAQVLIGNLSPTGVVQTGNFGTVPG